MVIKIIIPPILQHLAGNQESIQVNGSIVRECLHDLIRQFPDSQEWFDPHNPTVWIVLNQELVNLTDLDKHIIASDELRLILIIGGG